MMAKIYRFIFSILLVCFAAVGKAQTIDGKLYTPFNNYYQWIGGKFNSNLNIPKITATTGRDTGGIRYNLADSSMYVWTGSQWRQVGGGATPTLQQVTTAGKTTSDSIMFSGGLGEYSKLGYTAGGPAGGRIGFINLGSNFASTYTKINAQNIEHRVWSGVRTNTFPDTSGNLAVGVRVNGTTTLSSQNGVVDIGNVDTATVVKAYVTNAEAVTITKGQVVYIFGAQGDRAAVKLAKNTSDTFSSKTLGIVRADIAAGQAGWVTTQGQVSGINLGAYTAGDILWLDSVAGGFTKTKPVAPYHSVFVGVVERANAGNGLIYVKPQNGQELGELHDTKITSPTNNQVLAYTSATDIWENKSVTTALGYTPLDSVLNIAGSGVALVKGNDQIKRLKGGTGITITDNTDSVTIASTATGGIQWTGVDSMFAFQQAKNGIHLIDELYFFPTTRTTSAQVSGGPFGWEASNSGNAIAITDTLGTGIRMGTATSSNALSYIAHQQIGTGLINTQTSANDWHLFTTRVKVPTLNDGTQRFYLQIGLTQNLAANPNGYHFIYDLDSSMTGSGKNGNWQTRTSSANVRTWNQNYTTTAVTADTWTKLAILCNSSVAYFYVNEVLIATHTTNLLPAGSNYTPFASITKTAGIVARTFDIDYFTLDIKYSTPR